MYTVRFDISARYIIHWKLKALLFSVCLWQPKWGRLLLLWRHKRPLCSPLTRKETQLHSFRATTDKTPETIGIAYQLLLHLLLHPSLMAFLKVNSRSIQGHLSTIPSSISTAENTWVYPRRRRDAKVQFNWQNRSTHSTSLVLVFQDFHDETSTV